MKNFTRAGIDFEYRDKKLYVGKLNITVEKKLLDTKTDAEILTAYKERFKQKIKNRFFMDIKIRNLFFEIFKKSLTYFYDYFMGVFAGIYCIDVVKFDSWLRVPDGVSTNDYITKTYGIKALKLIKKLM